MHVKSALKEAFEHPCKIYYGLLFLCVLEVLVWSFCLVPCTADAHTQAAQAYYARETVNLRTAHGSDQRLAELLLDYGALDLALKDDIFRQQKESASVSLLHELQLPLLLKPRDISTRFGLQSLFAPLVYSLNLDNQSSEPADTFLIEV